MRTAHRFLLGSASSTGCIPTRWSCPPTDAFFFAAQAGQVCRHDRIVQDETSVAEALLFERSPNGRTIGIAAPGHLKGTPSDVFSPRHHQPGD